MEEKFSKEIIKLWKDGHDPEHRVLADLMDAVNALSKGQQEMAEKADGILTQKSAVSEWGKGIERQIKELAKNVEREATPYTCEGCGNTIFEDEAYHRDDDFVFWHEDCPELKPEDVPKRMKLIFDKMVKKVNAQFDPTPAKCGTSLTDAIEKVYNEIMAMSKEEFYKKIKEHKEGDITKFFMEMNAFGEKTAKCGTCGGTGKVRQYNIGGFGNYQPCPDCQPKSCENCGSYRSGLCTIGKGGYCGPWRSPKGNPYPHWTPKSEKAVQPRPGETWWLKVEATDQTAAGERVFRYGLMKFLLIDPADLRKME